MDKYKNEGIIQITTRVHEHSQPGGANGSRERPADQIWGLSNHGRLFQMSDHGWQLRLGELNG